MRPNDSRPRAIGVSGPASAGKSTLAAQLNRAEEYVPLKFADPLKAMLSAFYRCLGVDEATIREKLEGRLKFEPCPYLMGRTPRYAMQRLGTEWGRGLMHPDLWTEAWKRRAAMPVNPVVADDVRFENEAAAVREMGGVIVEIIRPGVEYARDHASEEGVGPDLVIANPDGRPDEMLSRLRALVWEGEGVREAGE